MVFDEKDSFLLWRTAGRKGARKESLYYSRSRKGTATDKRQDDEKLFTRLKKERGYFISS